MAPPGKPNAGCTGDGSCGYVPVFSSYTDAANQNVSVSMMLPIGTPLFDSLPDDGDDTA